MSESTPADSIIIRGLRAPTWIGVPTEERAVPQSVEFDLELVPESPLKELGDDLAGTVDYFQVCQLVRAVALEKKRRLIETLAEEVAAAVLERHLVARVTVEVRKFIIPDCQSVAVRLTRSR